MRSGGRRNIITYIYPAQLRLVYKPRGKVDPGLAVGAHGLSCRDRLLGPPFYLGLHVLDLFFGEMGDVRRMGEVGWLACACLIVVYIYL